MTRKAIKTAQEECVPFKDLSVGDVIRSPQFAFGWWSGADTVVIDGVTRRKLVDKVLTEEERVEMAAHNGKVAPKSVKVNKGAYDRSRGNALFVVTHVECSVQRFVDPPHDYGGCERVTEIRTPQSVTAVRVTRTRNGKKKERISIDAKATVQVVRVRTLRVRNWVSFEDDETGKIWLTM